MYTLLERVISICCVLTLCSTATPITSGAIKKSTRHARASYASRSTIFSIKADDEVVPYPEEEPLKPNEFLKKSLAEFFDGIKPVNDFMKSEKRSHLYRTNNHHRSPRNEYSTEPDIHIRSKLTSHRRSRLHRKNHHSFQRRGFTLAPNTHIQTILKPQKRSHFHRRNPRRSPRNELTLAPEIQNEYYEPDSLETENEGNRGRRCKFPFIYDGKTAFRCIADSSEKKWCSLTSNYDRDMLWMHCPEETPMRRSKHIRFPNGFNGILSDQFQNGITSKKTDTIRKKGKKGSRTELANVLTKNGVPESEKQELLALDAKLSAQERSCKTKDKMGKPNCQVVDKAVKTAESYQQAPEVLPKFGKERLNDVEANAATASNKDINKLVSNEVNNFIGNVLTKHGVPDTEKKELLALNAKLSTELAQEVSCKTNKERMMKSKCQILNKAAKAALKTAIDNDSMKNNSSLNVTGGSDELLSNEVDAFISSILQQRNISASKQKDILKYIRKMSSDIADQISYVTSIAKTDSADTNNHMNTRDKTVTNSNDTSQNGIHAAVDSFLGLILEKHGVPAEQKKGILDWNAQLSTDIADQVNNIIDKASVKNKKYEEEQSSLKEIESSVNLNTTAGNNDILETDQLSNKPANDSTSLLNPSPGNEFQPVEKGDRDVHAEAMLEKDQVDEMKKSYDDVSPENDMEISIEGLTSPYSNSTDDLNVNSDESLEVRGTAPEVVDTIYPQNDEAITLPAQTLQTSLPAQSELLPLDSESLLVKSESLPLKSESSPVKSESVPGKSESLPLKSESLPVKSKSVPAKSESSQAVTLFDTIYPHNDEALTLPTKIPLLDGHREGNTSVPAKSEALQVESESLPLKSESLAVKSESLPAKLESLPVKSESLPVKSESAPVKSESLPAKSETLPLKPESLPTKSESAQVVDTIYPHNDEALMLPVKIPTLSGHHKENKTLPIKSETLPVQSDIHQLPNVHHEEKGNATLVVNKELGTIQTHNQTQHESYRQVYNDENWNKHLTDDGWKDAEKKDEQTTNSEENNTMGEDDFDTNTGERDNMSGEKDLDDDEKTMINYVSDSIIQSVKKVKQATMSNTEGSPTTQPAGKKVTYKKIDSGKKPYLIYRVQKGKDQIGGVNPPGIDSIDPQSQKVIPGAKNINIIIINNRNSSLDLSDIENTIAHSDDSATFHQNEAIASSQNAANSLGTTNGVVNKTSENLFLLINTTKTPNTNLHGSNAVDGNHAPGSLLGNSPNVMGSREPNTAAAEDDTAFEIMKEGEREDSALESLRQNGLINANHAPEGIEVKTFGGTANGDNCMFPFIYDGDTYFNCITFNRDRPWCSVTANYDKLPVWGYCENDAPILQQSKKDNEKPTIKELHKQHTQQMLHNQGEELISKHSGIKTVGGNADGAPCTFPFVYDGQTHMKCIPREDGSAWCAASHSYDLHPVWGNCCDDTSC